MPEILQEIGAAAGLAAVLGLAVLSALYFSQARDVKRLREWAGRAPERSEQLGAATVPGRVVAQPQTPRAQGAAVPTPGPPPVPGKAPAAAGRPAAATPAGQAAPAAAASAAGAGAATAQQSKPSGVPVSAGESTNAKPGAPGAPGDAEAGSADAKPDTPGGAEAGSGASAGSERPGEGEARPAEGSPRDGQAATQPDRASEERTAATAGSGAATAAGSAVAEGTAAGGTAAASAAGGAAAGGEAGGSAAGGTATGSVSPASGAAGSAAAGSPPRPVGPQVPRPAAPAGPPRQAATPAGGSRFAGGRGSGSRPTPQETAILPPRRGRQGPSARYLVIGLVGLVVLGGAAAYGASQLLGDDDGGGESQESASADGARDGSGQGKPHKTGAVKPASVTVAVLNGTTVPGLAATLSDEVSAAGFKVGTITNFSDQQLAESVVQFASGHEAEARAVSRRLGITQREPVNPSSQALAGDATVIVIAGADKAP